MSIGNMLSMLLPTFESSTLKDELDKNCDAISAELLPRYQALQELVGSIQGKPFRSKAVLDLTGEMMKSLRGSRIEVKGVASPSILEYVIAALENTLELKDFIRRSIDKDIGRSLVTASMTFNKQTLLQLTDMIGFFTLYSSILLNFITAEEIASVPESNIPVKGIGPNDLQYLGTRIVSFNVALRVLATPSAKLKAEYGEIPEAIFDEDTYNDLVKSFGIDKTDPLGFSGVPFPLNVIYRVRLNIAEWQMDHYDEVVAAAKATEARVLLYKKMQAEGKGDAHIEKLIDGYEKRLLDLRRKRERLEKKYNLTQG